MFDKEWYFFEHIHETKRHYKNISFFLSLILLFLIYSIRFYLYHIIPPILIAIILAYLLNPFVSYFERKLTRLYALAIISGMIMISFILLIYFLVPMLINEIKSFNKMIPQFIILIKNTIKYVNSYLENIGLSGIILNSFNKYIASMEITSIHFLNNSPTLIKNLFINVGWMIIIPILSFYILKDKEYFINGILYIIPMNQRNTVRRIGKEIHEILTSYIKGQFLISFTIGLLTGIGLFLIGEKYSFILGLIMGICNIIPYFGPIIGAIPILLIAIIHSNKTFIEALLVILIIQQVESSYIAPKIISKSVGIHPVYVIVTLITGELLMGLFGMLISVPTILIIIIIIKAIHKEILYHPKSID